jgi:hypothetical protein
VKKNTAIIVAIVVLILIIGFVYFSMGNKRLTQSGQGGTSVTQKSLFTSIKDAMTKSLSLKCEYQGVQGKTITYLKGSNVRVTYQSMVNKADSGNAIMKDNKMWVWTEGKKEGFIVDVSEVDRNNQQDNKRKILDEVEKFKDKCSAAVISDSMFTPPSDVAFKDMTNLQQEMMKNLNATGVPKIPSGTPTQ